MRPEFRAYLERVRAPTKKTLKEFIAPETEEEELAFIETLNHDTSIIKLHLNSQRIGDAGAHIIAEILKTNTIITFINLGSNGISDAGIGALAEALNINTNLHTLELYHNEIEDAGASTIVKVLKINTNITKLVLHGNRIGNEGVANLAEVILDSKNFLEFSAGWGSLPRPLKEKVKTLLKFNKDKAQKLAEKITTASVDETLILGKDYRSLEEREAAVVTTMDEKKLDYNRLLEQARDAFTENWHKIAGICKKSPADLPPALIKQVGSFLTISDITRPLEYSSEAEPYLWAGALGEIYEKGEEF